MWVGLWYTLVAIIIVQYRNIQKWYNMSLFSLRSELDVLVDGVDVGSIWSAGTAVRTSSTYLFQNTVGTGDVLRARSSMCSIMMLATTTDTSDPIAVPKICWYTVPLKGSR